MSGNNKDSDSTRKCSSNIELVKNICKYLNYKQQLQLLQANKTLEQIIVNFVCKTKFAEVNIFVPYNTTKVLLSHNLDYNDLHRGRQTYKFYIKISRKYPQEKHLFVAKELDTILKLNAGNVKKLQIRKEIYTGCEIMPFLKPEFPNLTFLRCERIAVTNNLLQKFSKKLETLILIDCRFVKENVSFKNEFLKQEFPNLTFLRCENIILPHKILQQLSEKLETLILLNCSFVNEDGSFGTEIDIKIWKNMPNLKNLEISPVTFNLLEHAKCILHELKLQRLVLDFKILDINVYFGNTSENLKTCKYNQASNIHAFQSSKGFLNFETNFLPKFENLCDLSLKKTSLTGEFFGFLSTYCKNLTKLSLRECRIDNFITLPKLQELTLDRCRGATELGVMHINILNTVLGKMHLKWFTSLFTKYNGYLELFPISPTLEKLNCDFSESNLVELLRFNSANLQNLSDFYWQPCHGTNLSMRLSDVAPNLRVLRIPEQHLNSGDFYQMKFLQKLIISGKVRNIDVLPLLKHENLRELIILSNYLEQAAVDLNEFKAFKTKLLHIDIRGSIFSELKDFWFDLLKLNSKLSLTVYCYEDVHLIREVINSNNFPSRFKSVNICGVSIDCISIQNGSPEIMEFISYVERYGYRYRYFKLE